MPPPQPQRRDGPYLTLFLLHTLDVILTVLWVMQGAEEANPILAYYLHNHGVFLFGLVKLVLGWGGTYVLYRHRYRDSVHVAAHILCGVYCAVLALHGLGVFLLLGVKT